MPPFTIRRTPNTVQCFTEPLEGLGEAIPLDMVLVPGGTFTMGSPPDESEREDTEGPEHTVSVPSFFMGRYPITQAQWRIVAQMTQVNRFLKTAPSNFEGADHPVESISWYEAVEFCDRLSIHSGRPYRLPSESEWEYACRAGTSTPFFCGNTLTSEIANYNASYTYNDGPEGEYREETTPVAQFNVANDWGFCDMHGNVLEWCRDHWHETYDEAPEDGSAWIEGGNSDTRVLRGGSWNVNPRSCRSASRFDDTPDNLLNLIGFRVVCRAPRALQT